MRHVVVPVKAPTGFGCEKRTSETLIPFAKRPDRSSIASMENARGPAIPVGEANTESDPSETSVLVGREPIVYRSVGGCRSTPKAARGCLAFPVSTTVRVLPSRSLYRATALYSLFEVVAPS